MNTDEHGWLRPGRGRRSGTAGRLGVLALALTVSACDASTEESPSSTAVQPVERSAPAATAEGTAESAAEVGEAVSGTSTTVVVQAPADERPVRYEPWAIELDVGDVPVAAYQVELVATSGDATIVGVEGGTTDGFREPPYYDPKALAGGRIVLAAFNTRVALTRGRHRVATVHMREAGPAPTYELRLTAAGGPDGSPAAVGVELVSAKGEER